jgi:hypothetical protein
MACATRAKRYSVSESPECSWQAKGAVAGSRPPRAAWRGMQAPTDVAFAARGSRPLRASDQLLKPRLRPRDSLALTASNSLSVSAPSALSRAISLSCSTSSAAEGRRLDHGFLAPRPPVDELRKPAGPVTGVGIKGLHMRPFVAFDQHIQLTAVGEVIFRASRHQTQRPDRQQASGLQFTTDFGPRARTPCRLP